MNWLQAPPTLSLLWFPKNQFGTGIFIKLRFHSSNAGFDAVSTLKCSIEGHRILKIYDCCELISRHARHACAAGIWQTLANVCYRTCVTDIHILPVLLYASLACSMYVSFTILCMLPTWYYCMQYSYTHAARIFYTLCMRPPHAQSPCDKYGCVTCSNCMQRSACQTNMHFCMQIRSDFACNSDFACKRCSLMAE